MTARATKDGRAAAAAGGRGERGEGGERGERMMALVLTAAVAALAVVRMLHAGGLWRDEAGAARLATLPTLQEIMQLEVAEGWH